MADKEIERFIIHYDPVADLMAQACEQVPAGAELFKPCEKSVPWLYLLTHPATHFVIFRKIIEEREDHGFPAAYREPENLPADGAAGAAMIRERWTSFREWLLSLPDGSSSNKVTVPWAPVTMTVAEILGWLYDEGVHHRGQAWIYARMNGIKPPAIWGTEP